ncbi:MAG: hypothetical protein GY868_12970 [Deltaproteobacteria bacterium]|nr:hypothetical protein [Deltaproteobacteria bacterium]
MRHLEQALADAELSEPGRPRKRAAEVNEHRTCLLREQVLRYQLDHPGAVVRHQGGRVGYSDPFKRFILDLSDHWEGGLEDFCAHVEVPYPTLKSWQKQDSKGPYQAQGPDRSAQVPEEASEICRTIAVAFTKWQGSCRDFFRYAARRFNLSTAQIRRVLVICLLIKPKSRKGPRYRGSTQRLNPGALVVTDGKAVEVVSTHTGEIDAYNWQAVVDQTTACHTAGVITENECARGVEQAFEQTCAFMDKAPQGLLHDQKPVYQEAGLKQKVAEQGTVMIEATSGRGENKAVVEGEFGKFAGQVGEIYLDFSSLENMKKSALSEVIRAYTAGINHAGRAEFDGKSRLEVLKAACPNTASDLAFIKRLQADHSGKRPSEPLPTAAVARALLDHGFACFDMEGLDPKGKLRQWLASRFQPAAIRQALAILGAERSKGRIRNKNAHRYLVKVIMNCQDELDLRREEELLREFAAYEREAWLTEFNKRYEQVVNSRAWDPGELAVHMSESALYGSLFVQRSFWEEKLKTFLLAHDNLFDKVCAHVRRTWDAALNDRFQLIDKILSWQYQTARAGQGI